MDEGAVTAIEHKLAGVLGHIQMHLPINSACPWVRLTSMWFPPTARCCGKNNEAAELSKTLRAWRTRRDKYTAHDEDVRVDKLPETT